MSLRVANVGPRKGAEVVQLYLGLPRPAPGVVQPPKALKRFRRVEIPSGRSRDLTFVLEDRDFSFWDADAQPLARGARVLPRAGGQLLARHPPARRGGARRGAGLRCGRCADAAA